MQAKQCQWLPANHQRLGKARNSFSLTVLRRFKATLPTLQPWTSSLYNCRTINFCCLSHAVCGTLLRHPYSTILKSKRFSQRERNNQKPLGQAWSWLRREKCGEIPVTGSHLMSSEQGGPPIHVVLWLDHIHHLIGIQLESTLQLIQAIRILHGLLAVPFLPFLFLLFSTTLTLPDPPQIPTKQQSPAGWELLQVQVPMAAPKAFLIICLHSTYHNFNYIHF